MRWVQARVLCEGGLQREHVGAPLREHSAAQRSNKYNKLHKQIAYNIK